MCARQHKRKRTAFAFFGGHADVAPMRRRQLFGEKQPKTASAFLARQHIIDAVELAKDLRTKLNLNADPPILNVPPAIVTHAGPGILGVSFFTP